MRKFSLGFSLVGGSLSPLGAWEANMASNGGAPITGMTAQVSALINGLTLDGTWNKITDLGILCGSTTLGGALTPIKSSLGLTQIVNSGFVAGDYKASGMDCGVQDYLNAAFIGTGLIVPKSLHIGSVVLQALTGFSVGGFDRNGGNLITPSVGVAAATMGFASSTQVATALYTFAGTDYIQQNARAGGDIIAIRTSGSATAQYVNGVLNGSSAGASVTVPGTGSVFICQLGASNSQCGNRNRYYYVVARNVSAAEMLSIRARLYTVLDFLGRARGINTFVYDGDSITYGIGVGATPYCEVLKATPAWDGRHVNTAYNSRTIGDMNTGFANRVNPLRPDTFYSTRGICFAWGGTNDLNAGTLATTCQTNLDTYWASVRAAGYRVIAFTILPRSDAAWSGADETQRLALNISIRAASANYDFLIDVALFDGTGGTPNFSNPADGVNYQSDQLHLTTAGETALGNWIVANINPATV